MAGLEENERRLQLLGAISSLKRVAGIPNGKGERPLGGEDRFENGKCRVFTTDSDSAHLLLNLLSSAFTRGHSDQFFEKRSQGLPIPITFWQNDGGSNGTSDCELEFHVSTYASEVLAKKVKQLTDTLSAPDKLSSRRTP